MKKETITRKTLELLLSDVKSTEHVDLIDDAIKDYEEEFGCNLKEYHEKVRELREGYWD